MGAIAGKRVLLVEDEPIVAMALEDMLDALGCTVLGPATRLAEGVALAEGEPIDAAILDINLMGDTSTPIADVLRLRDVPFAFASGYGTVPEGYEEAPLIEKPYREQDVAAVLEVLLSRG
ncbi:MAG: response regulator [Sphingomonas sp.]|uniref:response regulator n=1 Tax=Sphingomonas sp. TaxID=28214 RepID=UPI001B1A9205|nr:response regulator [Sphingomonas sp.]MBO9622475.1 response regulator [Sphingomonas sp.]